MTQTVLVTGANGFVGFHVTKTLAVNHPTIGLIRQGRLSSSSSEGSLREISAWTEDELRRALEGVDAVVHAASVVHRPGASLAEYERFNTEGTRDLVTACKAQGIKKIVLLSTIKVYGENPSGTIDESTPVSPDSGYSSTKIDAERIVTEGVEKGWFSAAILRLCPVFGPGDKGNVRTMIQSIARRRFLLPGDGSTRKSIVHVSTVADVVRGIIAGDVRGTFVVADREAPSMRVLGNAIAASLGKGAPAALPVPLMNAIAGGVEFASRLVRRRPPVTRELIRKSLIPTVCRPARIEKALGIECHVDLSVALGEEIAWMRSAGLL